MNAQNTQEPQKARLKRFYRAGHNDRSKAHHQSRTKQTIQFIYAHLPPAVILATGQHLRAQTQIERWAQQLWFAENGRSEDTLDNWLRAEREVVQNLSEALLHRNGQESESTPACH
jgi:hypothetical protein